MPVDTAAVLTNQTLPLNVVHTF